MGQVARWLQIIGEYDFEIIHRAGRSHQNADSLSRRPCLQCGMKGLDTSERKDEPSGESEGIAPSMEIGGEEVEPSAANEGTSPTIYEVEGPRADICGVGVVPHITKEDWRKAQLSDEAMEWVIKAREKEEPRPDWEAVSPRSTAYKNNWLQWDQLCVRDGVLLRRWESNIGKEVRWMMVVPHEYRQRILQELHAGRTSGLGIKKQWPRCAQSSIGRDWPRMLDLSLGSATFVLRGKSPSKKRKGALTATLSWGPCRASGDGHSRTLSYNKKRQQVYTGGRGLLQ